MSTQEKAETPYKKTPENTSDFERGQLRYFLSETDLSEQLATLNPSLAWLPILWEMKVIKGEAQLTNWIERNFADVCAVTEVVANLRIFEGPETATVLEHCLNLQAKKLPPLLLKCWRLIIQQMKCARSGGLLNEWYRIETQLATGERSTILLERVANALRPKLKLGKRFSLYEAEPGPPRHPSDLMSIDYEVEDRLSAEEVLKAWPIGEPAKTDQLLLTQLTNALDAALGDATDAGVEGNEGYGIADSDVPSVARHEQNAYQSGFQAIVRVIAELWLRLAEKSPQEALLFVHLWWQSNYRLMRRLALFAGANAIVSADFAADMLIALPSGALFLTNSSVEAFRLLRMRWKEFTPEKQKAILQRLCQGPSEARFREGADTARLIDRCRFDFLAEMEREGLDIGEDASRLLKDIRARWPDWQLRPEEQAGFHVWRGGGAWRVSGDADKWQDVPDDQLVSAATMATAEADFLGGDNWQALCQSNPDRALRGLKKAAETGVWPTEFWERLLWARKEYSKPDTESSIALLLVRFPDALFRNIVSPASSWLDQHAKTLDDSLLWPLWDRIADEWLFDLGQEANGHDSYMDALNTPSGELVKVVLLRLAKEGGKREVPDDLQKRLDRLIQATGRPGRLARIRLAVDVPYLFERAPSWTKANIIPLFDWASPDALAAWSARTYSSYIGSPDLFGLTKKAFLELFSRADLAEDDSRVFADWLAAIMLANQSGEAAYPLTASEARSALRRAGTRGLSSVGHRLATELKEAKPEEKLTKWEEYIGPVFQSIWPLDVELQTSASTFELVQMLCAAGNAFSKAADVVLPFVRPDDQRYDTNILAISQADDVLYSSSPERMLDLIASLVGDERVRSAYGLGKALERLRAHAPALANKRKFQKLLSLAGSS
jgi:hypothetical protein